MDTTGIPQQPANTGTVGNAGQMGTTANPQGATPVQPPSGGAQGGMQDVLQGLGVMHTSLTNQLQSVNSNLCSASIASNITKYKGESSNFRDWISQVEKFSMLHRVGSVGDVAYESSEGYVSEFLRRWRDNPDTATKSWEELKKELAARFGDVTDPAYAFTLLRHIKQEKGQSVALFAEKLITTAEQAFGEQTDRRTLESQTLNFFIDGLRSKQLQIRLMREGHRTLQAAVASATKEQNLQRRFNLRFGTAKTPVEREEEPMDWETSYVNRVSTPKQCHKCYKFGHIARNCQSRGVPVREVRAQYQGVQPQANRAAPQGHSAAQGPARVEGRPALEDRICWLCSQKGHIKRNCPNKRDRSLQQAALQAQADHQNASTN